MNVKVVSTKPLSIEGKPDVKGLELTFEHDGRKRTLSTWIPPVVSSAAEWKPGQEVEIEEYTKDGKTRFKTPQARGGGGGFRGLSYEERVKLDGAEQERMDTRTALMQAVAFHTVGGETRELGVLDTASKYLGWLREQRSPESAMGRHDSGSDAGTVGTPPAVPASQPSTDQAVEKPASGSQGDGEGSAAPADGLLDEATKLYKTRRSLMRAASMLWDVKETDPATELANAQLRELIDRKAVSA